MKSRFSLISTSLAGWVALIVFIPRCGTIGAPAVPFATNGGLKMLYDNRQYPQAIAHGDMVHIVWRAADGMPYYRTYNRATRTFGPKGVNLMGDVGDLVDRRRFKKDHHFAPVIWWHEKNGISILCGCHNTPGRHVIEANVGALPEVGDWVAGHAEISNSMSYPKIHRVYGAKTLVCYREKGHLGSWRYRTSSDGGLDWDGPPMTIVDLNAEPQDGRHASHAGSYCTTAINSDGTRLHVAFIWKVEDPVFNERYQTTLTDHTQRYNLYYFFVDLATHQAFNIYGEPVAMPLRKSVADKKCLVWDTGERVAAVGPSIALDRHGLPHFMLPVSDQTPLDSHFHFVTWHEGKWRRVRVTPTLHPFNASHLEVLPNGEFRAFLIAGEGEEVVEKGMDEYGWGERVEVWVSSEEGMKWERKRDLTPKDKPGWHWQNVQPVIDSGGQAIPGLILFYGWKDRKGAGTAFLWDGR